LVPLEISRKQYNVLESAEVDAKFIPVEGEGHTFSGQLVKGSKTWDTQRKAFDWLAEKMAGI
jgi:dipeptidyl aminopeptidase/acylaminoacyl peptidase